MDWQTAVNDMQTCNDTLVQANADIQTIKASTAAVGKAALASFGIVSEACPSSDDLRQRSVFGSEALAHLV